MEVALSSLYEKLGSQLHAIICSKVGHQHDCHDIMQEVYLKILLNNDKIEQADNTAGYLVRLTNNAVIDHYRRKPQTELIDPVATDDSAQKDQSLQLADCCLRPMIESLPDIHRDALVMTELEGMKHKDYAEKVGISLSNAKVRVQRAKEKLKQVIMQCCSYDFDKYGNIVDCVPTSCCKK